MSTGGRVTANQSGDGQVPDVIDDGGTQRLAVDAKVTGVTDVNLDEANDEVTVANTSDGGTTRALAKGDASGRFQIDVERIGNVAPSMDGSRQQVNATLLTNTGTAVADLVVTGAVRIGTHHTQRPSVGLGMVGV